MAVGLLLWCFWIALQLNCSTSFSSPRGQSQPALDGENQLDDLFISYLAPGEGDGGVLNIKPRSPGLASYEWPSVADPPSLLPSVQNMPDTVDQPEPQTQLVNVDPASVAYPSPWEYSGQSNEVESPTVQVSPPQKPSSPKLVGQPSYKDWMSMPFNEIFDKNLLFGQLVFQPENSVRYEKHWVPVSFPQMSYQPVPPPPSRQSVIRKSKNGYHRERLQQSNNIYWADPKMQQMKGSRKFNPLPKM
ncbi:uncharacterized protein LOC105929948 isoform X7 [Fundulus heteroclitus]|uniref:uncharacterized protein LOC105929948 isoform X7 n=1 Tax=Fundulus heteroclitus TaxID=8078 RepID=UPI00165B701C|nr:uncharacterized protein LOC105929948 isoform X7 [Fundulus heteroclitus]